MRMRLRGGAACATSTFSGAYNQRIGRCLRSHSRSRDRLHSSNAPSPSYLDENGSLRSALRKSPRIPRPPNARTSVTIHSVPISLRNLSGSNVRTDTSRSETRDGVKSEPVVPLCWSQAAFAKRKALTIRSPRPIRRVITYRRIVDQNDPRRRRRVKPRMCRASACWGMSIAQIRAALSCAVSPNPSARVPEKIQTVREGRNCPSGLVGIDGLP